MKYMKFIAVLLLVTAFGSVYANMNEDSRKESEDRPEILITWKGDCHGENCHNRTINPNVRFLNISGEILDYEVEVFEE